MFGEEHLRTQVDTVVDFARRHDIAIILELHQFLWSPCVGGNGAPAWSCEGRYAPGPLAPFEAQHDFEDACTHKQIAFRVVPQLSAIDWVCS